ncbi:NTP/NDP exchange transporter [Simkania negevensis]|uniref:ADP,ATP carrier protein n=1 Tax=Simkania negevensis TaxID=83561 RepID=A0ABS3APM4_9BACT|nr:NTP/NDP exchange transporter [Simkania negevensis]
MSTVKKESSEKDFGKFRSFFWPVHGFELKKLLPMFFMFFFISFNYTILRDTKDALLITAKGSGAEVIPFVKFWLVLPAAVIFMIVFAKLSNVLSKKKLFYVVIVPFLLFFALFPIAIYPFRDMLHPTDFADYMQSILPAGFNGLIALLRNWTFAAFYVLAELWGSVMLSLMFWGFANEITRVGEAKRFYSLFGLGANLALLVAGPAVYLASKARANLPEGVDGWGVSLSYLMTMVIISGIGVMVLYWWINKYVLTDTRHYNPGDVRKKKAKVKLTMKESFLFLVRSKYMGCLAIIVIAYGVSINIIEVTWKGQLKQLYPNANDYSAFMGIYSTLIGITTVLMMLFVGGNVIRRFGWTKAALFTPVILLVTGLGFFALIIYNNYIDTSLLILGMTPLFLTVIIGTVQNIMSKSSKYSLFDPTKEMSYIPLDQDQKVKGKAAIDVVAARLGKSGGSLIQQGLIIGLGTLSAITPYVAVILMVIIAIWIVASRSLGKQFNVLIVETEREEATREAAIQVSEEEAKAEERAQAS